MNSFCDESFSDLNTKSCCLIEFGMTNDLRSSHLVAVTLCAISVTELGIPFRKIISNGFTPIKNNHE